MVECTRVKYSQVELSSAMLECSIKSRWVSVKESQVEPSSHGRV